MIEHSKQQKLQLKQNVIGQLMQMAKAQCGKRKDLMEKRGIRKQNAKKGKENVCRQAKTSDNPKPTTQKVHLLALLSQQNQPHPLYPSHHINQHLTSTHQSDSYKTLSPYLFNIQQQYTCTSTSKQGNQNAALYSCQVNQQQQRIDSSKAQSKTHTSNYPAKQNNKNQKQSNLLIQTTNPSFIELSLSRQQELTEEQLLLHNSISSKFLESPTLSLGLIESKITKMSLKSRNASRNKIRRVKDQGRNQVLSESTHELLCMAQDRENNSRNDERKVTQKTDSYSQTNEYNYSHQNSKEDNSQNRLSLEANSSQIPEYVQKLTKQSKQTPSTDQTQFNYQDIRNPHQNKIKPHAKHNNDDTDQQFHQSIISSYQMEVQYLRKINLLQGIEIQKLRRLVRLHQKEGNSINGSNEVKEKNRQDQMVNCKTDWKNSQDVLKQRQMNGNIEVNTNKNNAQEKGMCRSISFSMNKDKCGTTETLNSIITKKGFYQKQSKNMTLTKPNKLTLTKGIKNNAKKAKTKSHNMSLNENTIGSSLLNPNVSCSTYFGQQTSEKKPKKKVYKSKKHNSSVHCHTSLIVDQQKYRSLIEQQQFGDNKENMLMEDLCSEKKQQTKGKGQSRSRARGTSIKQKQ